MPCHSPPRPNVVDWHGDCPGGAPPKTLCHHAITIFEKTLPQSENQCQFHRFCFLPTRPVILTMHTASRRFKSKPGQPPVFWLSPDRSSAKVSRRQRPVFRPPNSRNSDRTAAPVIPQGSLVQPGFPTQIIPSGHHTASFFPCPEQSPSVILRFPHRPLPRSPQQREIDDPTEHPSYWLP